MGEGNSQPRKLKVRLERVKGEPHNIIRLVFENKTKEPVKLVTERAFLNDAKPTINLFLFRPGGVPRKFSSHHPDRKNAYTEEEYTVIEPGQSISSRDIDLADYYDLPSDYKVSYFAVHPRIPFAESLTLISNPLVIGELAKKSSVKTVRGDDEPFRFGFPRLPEFPKLMPARDKIVVGAGIAAGLAVAARAIAKK